jgi:methylmalonyl-CoA mutase cobalamin-binding domain/chain
MLRPEPRAQREGGVASRPVRVLWSRDASEQTRGYWAIAVALYRAGCEVVLGGYQSAAEVAETASQEQADVVGYRAMGDDALQRVLGVQAALSALAGSASAPLAAAGVFEPDEAAALRTAGVREVFEILTPVDEIAARLAALGVESAAARPL